MATFSYLAWRVSLSLVSMQLLVILTSPPVSAAPGSLDNSFGQSGKVTTTLESNPNGTMVTDGNGNIYVATSKYSLAKGHDVAVYKMDSNGAMVWPGSGIVTFDFASGTDDATDLALDSLGRIYVVGYAVSGVTKAFILRLTADGVLDSSFGTGGKVLWVPTEFPTSAFTSISIDSSDRVFVTGQGTATYTSPNRTVNDAFVASFTATGALDSNFSTDGYTLIPSSTYGDGLMDSVIDNNGDLVVSGQWLNRPDVAGAGNYTQFLLARLNVDGTFDTGFSGTGILKTPRGNLSGWWKRISVDGSNNYLLTGMTYRTSAQTEWELAFDKYTDTGTNLLSKTFNTGWGEEGNFISPGPNGTVLIGARTTIPRSGTSYYDSAAILLRLDSQGLLDTTFGIGGMTAKNMAGDLTSGSMVNGGWLGLTRYLGGWAIIKYLTPDFASAPASLTATPGTEQIDLSWSIPNSDGGASITDYAIEISTDNSNWSPISDAVSLTRNLSIGSLTPNSTYYFRVAAITSAGSGLFAYTTSVTTLMPVVPGVPSLTCSISGLQVSLAWSPSQSGGRFETGFQIQRKIGAGAWIDLTSKAPSVLSYSETTTASQSGEVFYRIRSSNDGGNSDWSNPCTVLVPSVPSAPSSITSPSLIGLNMTMSWSAPANGGMQIAAYEVEKRVGVSGNWSQVYNSGPIGAGTQTYTETKSTSTAGETHFYRIRAVNEVGNSNWSSTFSLNLPSIPTSPLSLVAVGGSSDITISWSDPANIVSSGPLTYLYQITNNGLTWSDFTPSSNPSVRSAVFDSAIGGSSYRFRLKAVNAFGESNWSTSSNLSQLAASYTLTYIYNNATSGNTISSATYIEGNTGIRLPTPTRTGYTFVGWFNSPSFTGRAVVSPYSPSDTRAIYAKWTRNAVKAIAGTKPTISGTAKVSKTLTAKKGTWTGYPAPTVSYQWYSCSKKVSSPKSSVPKSCKKITGATKSTLKLKKAQKGKYLAVLVTGKSSGTSKTSWLTKSTGKAK